MGGLDFANPIPFVHDLLIENFSVQLIIEFRRQYLSYYMIVFLLSFCTLIDWKGEFISGLMKYKYWLNIIRLQYFIHRIVYIVNYVIIMTIGHGVALKH